MFSNDRILIFIAIVVGVLALAGIIAFTGEGNVRHVSIFWQERVEQTA